MSKQVIKKVVFFFYLKNWHSKAANLSQTVICLHNLILDLKWVSLNASKSVSIACSSHGYELGLISKHAKIMIS